MRAKHTLVHSFFSMSFKFQNSTLFAVFLFIVSGLCSFQSVAQTATITNARHESVDQRTVSVLFDNTIQSAPAPAINGWVVRIGGVSVTVNSVTVLGTRVEVRFDATAVNGVPYILTAQSAAGVTVSYDPAAAGSNTNTNGSGNEINGFTNVVSQNNSVFACSDLIKTLNGIYPGATADICSPVVVNFYQAQYVLSLRFRNSTTFDITRLRYAINWGDATATDAAPYQSDLLGAPAPTFVDPLGFTGGNPGVVMTARPTHTYPATNSPAPNICSWDILLTPYYNLVATCFSIATTNTFATYDTDNANSGVLNLPPSVVNTNRVCLGNNVGMRFSDNTLLNCRNAAGVEQGVPNDLSRWIRIVYGSQNLATNIPDIRVSALPGPPVQVTADNAAGTLLFAGGYFPTGGGGIGVPDFNGVIQLATPVSAATATAFMQQITTLSGLNQAVGDRFYVRLDYWDICNPYNPAAPNANRVSIENYIEIVSKPTLPAAVNKEYCFTEVIGSGGTCGAPTGEYYELTAGSITGNTEVIWYNNLADANGNVNAIASSYGTNCRFLRPENTAIGTGGMASPGVYSVFARYRTGTVAPNNCLSDPIQVTITRRSALTAPGAISPSTSEVCDGALNVPYTLPAAAPIVAVGGTTQYAWSFGGAGATVDAPATTQNITADFNIGGSFLTTTRTLDVYTQFTTAATTGGNCAVGPSSRTVTIYGPTLGGTASGGAPYCQGADANNITLTGHRGDIVRWEVNFNSGGFVDAGVGTAATFDPGVLAAGTYEYRAVVTNGPCLQQNSTTTTINVAVNPTLSGAGPDQALCGVLTATLDATPAAPGVGTWTFVSSVPARPAPVFSNINSRSSTVSITAGNEGAYTLRWTVVNLPCSSFDDVVIDYGSDPTNPNAGTAQDICGQTTNMAGNTITIGTGTWSVFTAPAGGTLTIVSPNSPTSQVNLAGGIVFGTYQLRWRSQSGTCPPEDSFVNVTFNRPPTITGPADFSACVDTPPSAPFNIALTGARGGTYGGGATQARWEVVTGTGTFASNNTATGNFDATNPVEDTYRPSAADYTAGTVTLRLITDDPTGACTPVNDPVVITIDRLPTAADAGAATMSVCGTTAALTGNTPSVVGAVGTWSTPAVGVTFTPDANTPNATANSLPLGTTRLTWTITTATGVCSPSSDFIDVTRNATPANNTQPLTKCVDIPFGTTAVVTLVELQALNDAITGIAGSTNRTVQFFTNSARTIPYPANAPLSNGDIVYTIVTRTDVTPQCTTNGQVNITVAQRPLTTPQNPEFCEDFPVGSNTRAGINLTTFNNAIKNGVAANTVAWFSDAARTLAVATPTSVTANNGTRFYARVTNPTTTCTDTTSLRVILNPIPSPNPLLGPSNVCADLTAAILYQLTVSNAGYTYTWSVPEPPFDKRLGGTSTDDLILLSFPVIVSPGQDISVIETSDKGCIGQPNVKNITVDTSPPAITIVGPSAVCANEAGVIYEVANLANTTYSWTVPIGGSIINGQGTFRITVNFGTVPGLVTVTPTTTSGCPGNPDDHAVAINKRPTLASISATVCSDAPSGIILSATSNPGDEPAASYNVVNVAVPFGLTPSSMPTVNGIPDTGISTHSFTNSTGGPLLVQYTVVPVSALGCEGASRLVNLTINPEPVLDPTLSDAICSSTEDVNIILKVATGSFSADQYEIVSVNANGLTPIAGTPLAIGIFTETVLTDDRWQNLTGAPVNVEYFVRPRNSGTGCVGDPAIPVVVTVNPEPQVTAASDIICSGESPRANLLSTTPAIAVASYSWIVVANTGVTGAVSGSDPTHITNILVNNSAVQQSVTYEVRANADATVGGCQGPPTTITVAVNPAPSTNNIDQIVCSTVSGGTTYTENLIALQPSINSDGSLTFTWHTTEAHAIAGTNAMSVATASAYPLDGTAIFVRVSNGICFKVQRVQYTVNQRPTLNASITSAYNGAQLSCATSSNGIITAVQPIDGSSPFQYSIDGGTSYFTSPIFNGLSASGNPYTVTVRDLNGCIGTAAPLNFVAPTAVNATTSVTSNYNGAQISCNGATDGSITVVGSGGTVLTTYQYSILELPSNNTGATSGVFTGLGVGSYTFVVRDANNCTFTTATVTLTAPTIITPVASLTSQATCNGDSDGVITVVATGGTVTTTYTYTLNQAPFTVNTSGVFTGLPVGVYSVNVTDNNSCLKTSNFIAVTQPALLNAFASVTSNYNGSQISCNGANDGELTVTANGGNGGYTYVFNGVPANTSGDVTGVYNLVHPGSYTVTVTDSEGCNRTTAAVAVNQPSAITIQSFITNTISCFGDTDGQISLVATGGTGAHTYVRNDGPVANPGPETNASGVFSNLAQFTYNFTVRDLNLCPATAMVVLNQPALLTATAAVASDYNGSDISCPSSLDGIVQVTAVGGTVPYNYVMFVPSTGVPNSTGVFNGLGANNYQFRVTDARGCTAEPTASVIAPSAVQIDAASVTSNYNGQDISCTNLTDAEITIVASGGSPGTPVPYRYTLNLTSNTTGLTDGVFNAPIAAGSYTLYRNRW